MLSLPKLNVKIVGSSCGLSDFGDGATHQSIADISVIRTIPNMTIIVPVDAIETRKVVKKVIEYDGSVYIRINRNDLPNVTKEPDLFEIGKMQKIADGQDVVIFACGLMVSQALKARGMLLSEGISLRIINVSTIKPLDKEQVIKFSEDIKKVITAEENNVIRGLGSAICEALEDQYCEVVRLGINDEFGQSASSYEDLICHYHLTPKDIMLKAKTLLS